MNAPNHPAQKRRHKTFRHLTSQRLPRAPDSRAPKPTIQLVYAHFPSARILAAEHGLRAQTQIQQHAQQLWLAHHHQPEHTFENWLRAEREVVQELCAALENSPLKQ
jgi:hypothetical protein